MDISKNEIEISIGINTLLSSKEVGLSQMKYINKFQKMGNSETTKTGHKEIK